METIRRAVIDVGTNSIKLLIGDVRGDDISPIHEESRQTRLGKGFYESHKLQPESIARTAEAVWEFAEIARERNAITVRVIATSAARDAVNPADLTVSIERACGLRTEIISGTREADWAFRGVTTDTELASLPLLLLDVGGGSSEFIIGHGREKTFAHSFPLGTVRLMEAFPHSDPPRAKELAAAREWLRQFIRTEIRPQLEPYLKRDTGEIHLVGTGGTASILARLEKQLPSFDRDQIERATISLESIQAHCHRLWSLRLEDRKKTPGLPERRADVILTGVLIYELVMAELGFKTVRVSTRGLRFAALLEGAPPPDPRRLLKH